MRSLQVANDNLLYVICRSAKSTVSKRENSWSKSIEVYARSESMRFAVLSLGIEFKSREKCSPTGLILILWCFE